MLITHMDYFREKPDDLEKTTILLDNGYHPQQIQMALEQVYPEIMTKVDFELAPKPSPKRKLLKANQDLCPSRPAGSLSALMPGWSVVKTWSKTLSGRSNMLSPKFNFVLFDC
jgi:hypothetical protein